MRHECRIYYSRDPKLAFSYHGSLYLKESLEAEVRKLEITLQADDKSNTSSFQFAKGVGEIAVSPDGSQIAFISRGEVFVTSVDFDEIAEQPLGRKPLPRPGRRPRPGPRSHPKRILRCRPAMGLGRRGDPLDFQPPRSQGPRKLGSLSRCLRRVPDRAGLSLLQSQRSLIGGISGSFGRQGQREKERR